MVWSINTRTITFSSPALPEIVGQGYGGQAFRESMLTVRSVRGREAVGELFEYTVLAQVENPDLLRDPTDAAQIDLERIVGTHGTVAIEITGIGTFRPGQAGDTGLANIGADTRYINGQIVSARIICVEDRAAVYEFVLRPSVWVATQNKDSRIFSGSVDDVLAKLLGHYTFIDWRIGGPAAKRVYPRRDFIRQAWESDWNLALRLMEEWGLFFWFEHRADDHKLVISDTLGGFHNHGIAYETLRYHTDSRIDEEHISELSVTYSVTAGKVTVNDHNYMQPTLQRNTTGLREEYEDISGTADGDIEIYAPAEFAQPDANGNQSNDSHEEGQHLARVKLQAQRCAGLRVHGKGHLRGLQSGRTFTLAGYPQTKANRAYIVLACEMELTEVGTSSGASRDYTVNARFELQPDTEYFRLPQVTPRPHVDDEYAVIVAPAHHENERHEVWIDQHNRVRVQYDWDREANYDGANSIWLRVASQWQGAQMGMVSPGRVGQMVIVSHIHGDPDRPYVSAFVVDKYNAPPWELPHNSALSGIRSQGLGQTYGSNHLALDDTDGEMQAQLASDHANSSLTLGFNTRIDGNKGRQDARGEGFELRTDAHGVARAAKGMLLTTEARNNAEGHALDMSETVARLTQARDIHESLSDSAQRHGAHDSTHNQNDVTRSIKSANDAIRGTTSAERDTFSELSAPHLTVASPAGIQTTTAGSTHIASDQDLAVTTGRNVSMASGRSWFASVREQFAVFVQKAGIKLVAAAGKIRLEAQSDSVQILGKKGVELNSADGWIELTSLKGIRLNGGGTVLEISPRGLLGFTNAPFLIHAASHGTDAPLDKPVKMPLANVEEAKVAEPFVLIDPVSGLGIADQPYRITLDDGQVITGRTDDKGATALVLAESMQPATVEILHDDGTGNPSSILTAMLTQSADARAPDIASQKKPIRTKINDHELESQDDLTSSSGRKPYFALCQSYNWGMRYSVKDQKDSMRLAFPVAEQFAKDMHEVLIEQVQWGENYFGRGSPKLTITADKLGERFELSIDSIKALQKCLPAKIFVALTSVQSGPFALPEAALPMVEITNKVLINNAKGTFDPANWTLTINTAAFAPLFESCNLTEQAQRATYTRVALKDLVDTVFHETRHCQQHFWVYALVQQRTEDFSDTPNIKVWPSAASRIDSDAKDIIKLAATQPIPDDSANLLGIKQMAVGMYAWNLYRFQLAKWYPSYADNEQSFQQEYEHALKQATYLLGHGGAEQSAIDVDDMVQESGYYARPWEDDALCCGEIAGSYWSSDHAPDDMVANQCSRLYATSFNSRRNATAGGGAAISTDTPKRGG